MTKWINTYIGTKIHQFRIEANLSQETLGGVLNVSRTSIANYEAGNQAISIVDLFQVAIFLNKKISDFLPPIEEIKSRIKPPEQKVTENDTMPESIKKDITSFIKK